LDGVRERALTAFVERRAVSIQAWIVLAIVTALSLLRTGYEFNIINNAFHIPIVLRFEEMLQFAGDPFVLSLSRFVSPVYRLLALVASEETIAGIFFAGLALTHLLTFLGLLRIAVACGIDGLREQTTLLLLLSAAWYSYGYSPIGGDGLLTSYFTHTELARAVAMLSIALLLTGRFAWAGALAGLAFTLNAFVGVWVAVPLGVVGATHLAGARDAAQRGAILRALLIGALAFAAVAAPVAAWIVVTTAGQEVAFDYPTYLREVFANHFFLDVANAWSLRNFAFLVLAGALAAGLLGRRRDALLVLGALCAVFVLGALAGEHLRSRLILNLHLLRVDGMIGLLCTTLAATVAVVHLRQPRPLGLVVVALTAFGLIDGKAPLVAGAMALAHAIRLRSVREWLPPLPAGWQAMVPRVLLVGLLLVSSGQAALAWRSRQAAPEGIPTLRQLRGVDPAVRDWLEVQEWARRSTPPMAQFMLPPGVPGFRAGAQRRVWGGGEDTAVGLWAPESYPPLRQRLLEVRRLDDVNDRLAYACAHGIDFVVLDLRASQGRPFDPAQAAFLNRWFEVQQPRCGSARQ
jgi:hypothetical protein